MADYYKNHIGVLKFDIHTYDFELSDTSTYTLLTYNRFYIQFDSIITPDSKQILDKFTKEQRYGETFVLTFTDVENTPFDAACRIKPANNPDVMYLEFCPLDSLYDMLEEERETLKEEIAIAKQFTNDYFNYDTETGTVFVGKCENPLEKEYSADLDAFEEDIRRRISESSYDDLSKFISDVRRGVRSFTVSLNSLAGDTLNLTAMAIYKDCVHIRTVGRIGGDSMPQKQLNLYDQLKGVFLKSNIADYAKKRIEEQHLRTGIAIIDLDNFKLVNDNYGHQKGDEVLHKAADIISRCCQGMGRVGTIGGDEFMVVYENFNDIYDIRFTLMGMQSTMADEFEEMRNDGVNITLSTGCSVYPDDYNGNFEEMFKLADTFLYRAKDKGKDRYIVYNREKHGTVENLLKYGFEKVNMDKSEYVCKLAESAIRGELPDVEKLISEIVKVFSAERVMLYNKTDRFIKAHNGVDISFDVIRKTIRYLYDENLQKEYNNGYMCKNNIDHFAHRAPEVHNMLKRQGIQSFQHFVFTAKSGKEYVLSIEMINSKCTWNKEDVPYYRIIIKILEDIL